MAAARKESIIAATAVGGILVGLAGESASTFLAPWAHGSARGSYPQPAVHDETPTYQDVAAHSQATAAAIGAGALVAGAALLNSRQVARKGKSSKEADSTRVVSTLAFENEIGVQPPFGFWDPLNFTADGDVVEYKRRRQVEIKHGRISMLACIGYIVPEYFKFPGYISPSSGIKFADVPNGLAALTKVPSGGWAQYVYFCGFTELFLAYNDPNADEPGDQHSRLFWASYSFGAYGIPGGASVEDPEAKKKKLAAEIANGRLAMAAIIGMFFQDGLTGSAWGDWSVYTDSPLRAFENEIGVQPPFGFWDPLNFTADGDVVEYKRRRQVEIKHGRISMLACIGYIVPEYFKFPGYISPSSGIKFADVPNGLAALTKVPSGGWAQYVYFCGFTELFLAYNDPNADEPGDQHSRLFWASYSFGAYGIPGGASVEDPEAKKKKLAAEIANGRLAMAAIIGMFFQDGLTGSAWGDWSVYTDSPLRAFENEIGVQPPFGFWDPLNFTADGDVVEYKRRRQVEIKHGRISMLACIGYIVPEYFKFPGYISPSSGIKFADVPNGLAALTKVPSGGWAQYVYFCGFTELFLAYNDPNADEPGDQHSRLFWASYSFGAYGIPGGASVEDPEAKKKKLAAEIANGRLAMAAIIGMFFQDGLTGSAWGDWSVYTDSPLRAFENEIGVQPPFGFWDPLNFTADGDVVEYKRRRQVEIKHGRISMLACIGYIVPEYFKFPGYISPSSGIKFADVPNGLAALTKVPSGGWAQYVYFCGFTELFLAYNDPNADEPGDQHSRLFWASYSFGAYGIPGGASVEDPEAKKKKLAAEIANGRLAMAAIIGMFFQDGLTGSAWGDWSVYTDSPLRAFENEIGVQPPFGFWDPLNFTADGDVVEYKRRRQVEIKHGRISMLACIGYIVPEYFKFPGYISPSSGIKFADVPNGLAALTKVPSGGWAQYVYFCGFTELFLAYNDPNADEPGDQHSRLFWASYSFGAYGIPGGASVEDPEAKKKKLAAEIANGRLAMAAIIGMFFQDGLTGSAWGDWSVYTDSPLRAFENEIGVQPPFGFWDPLNFTADGDVVEYKRRRQVEIKHGRISMLACIGYIVPEYFKFPGYISPSSGIKFADVPNGLAALTKVPSGGWAQYVYFCGFTELFLAYNDPNADEPGDQHSRLFWASYSFGAYGIPGGASVEDPEAKKKKLAAEIANGRLAMAAIIGMFFQDGLTGSAWGDWSVYTDSPLR
ncbi:Light-harvesting complex [Amphidinium carterae]